MKESSATDNNNNSLIVEEEDEERTSGVEIVATDTEESLSADVIIGQQNRNRFSFTVAVGSLVVAAAAAGGLGIAFYGGYSIRSSKQQVVAALMNEKVDGYKFEDIGRCLDESGERYDYIAFSGITTPQACGERCSGCPGGGQAGLVLRGFDHYKGRNFCYCLVDDVATTDPLEGACEGYAGVSYGRSGSGEIQGANDDDRVVCYKRLGGKSKSSKRGKSKSSKGKI